MRIMGCYYNICIIRDVSNTGEQIVVSKIMSMVVI